MSIVIHYLYVRFVSLIRTKPDVDIEMIAYSFADHKSEKLFKYRKLSLKDT